MIDERAGAEDCGRACRAPGPAATASTKQTAPTISDDDARRVDPAPREALDQQRHEQRGRKADQRDERVEDRNRLLVLQQVVGLDRHDARHRGAREGFQRVQAGEGARAGRAHGRKPDRMTNLRYHAPGGRFAGRVADRLAAADDRKPTRPRRIAKLASVCRRLDQARPSGSIRPPPAACARGRSAATTARCHRRVPVARPVRIQSASRRSTSPAASALVAMAIYHFTWDLEFFGYVEPARRRIGGWKLFARCIASSFLFLVGVSLFLAHRERHPLAAASCAAWRWSPARRWRSARHLVRRAWGFIFFGILHEIALASLLGLAFLRLPAMVTLIAAALVIAAPYFARSALFDHPWLWWPGCPTSTRAPTTTCRSSRGSARCSSASRLAQIADRLGMLATARRDRLPAGVGC